MAAPLGNAGKDIMARDSVPGTVIITCPFPLRLSAVEAAGAMRSTESDVAITWIASIDHMTALHDGGAAASTAGSVHAVALDIDPTWLRAKTLLRSNLRQARDAWPDLTAAVLRGPVAVEHRDVLVQEGITTIHVDTFDEPHRGSRRPAPRGWPCRSILWGLWEVSSGRRQRQGVFGRMWSWYGGRVADGLTILDAGGGSNGQGQAAATRHRLERHVAWARRHIHAGRLRSATLADLPTVIAGGGTAGLRGSVLRAA